MQASPPSFPSSCLFCDIVAGKVGAEMLLQNDHVIAFRDIRPIAPAHALVIPREHMSGIGEVSPSQALTLGHLLLAARDVAGNLGLSSGYRVVINQGRDAGQSVFHLHCHVLGGRPMGWPPG
ncbi:MAG: histidine triad nucleotide-binding protein [Myxococcota bacterium]|nr:histidine triad nucleotide-binding protein [Myxococcota bacterium]